MPSSEEWVDVKAPRETRNLIDVYDFGVDGQPQAKQVLKHEDCMNLEDDLQNLPEQGESCRVYLMATDGTMKRIITNYLQTLGADVDERNEKGFDSLTSQWSKTRPRTPHSLDLFVKAPSERPTSFENNFDSPRLLSRVARVTPSIAFYRTDGDALISEATGALLTSIIVRLTNVQKVVIDIQASRSTFAYWHNDYLPELFTQYVRIFLEESKEQNRYQKRELCQELRIQLYLLRFYSTYLRLYKDLWMYVEQYHQSQSHIVNPGYPKLQLSTMAVIVDSVHDCNLFLDAAMANSVMLSSLVDVMRATFIEATETELRYFLAEIEATSNWLSKPFAQLTSRMSRNVELTNLLRSMQESINSRTLNLLAYIFLPMSLATSLLSMSTRFAELGPLLYDFCGVIVLFASLLLMVFLMLKIYQRIKNITQFEERRNLDSRHTRNIFYGLLFWAFVVILWPIVLSSFIVGMVVDISLGGRILGLGLAVLVGLGLIFFGFAYCLVDILESWERADTG